MDPGAEPAGAATGVEYVPCPTCWLNPAEVVPPASPGDFPLSRCVRGHVNSLVPSVLGHLRQVRELAVRRWEREGR